MSETSETPRQAANDAILAVQNDAITAPQNDAVFGGDAAVSPEPEA